MKHFFKRVNRGIVLGVVLLIVLVIFIWQDESTFQKQTPAIEHTVTSYMEAVSKINTFDTDFQKIGATMTNAQQTVKLQEFTKMIDQYWAESNVKNGITKSTLLQQLEDMVAINSKGKGYIQKFSVKLDGNPTIKKDGPGSASADMRYTVVMEYAGSPTTFLGLYTEPVSHFSGNGNQPSADAAADTTRKRETLNVQITAELENTGGTWRIASMNGGYGSSGQTVSIE